MLKQSCEVYEQNAFIQNLLTTIDFPFESRDIENVIAMYRLGTVQYGYPSGATTFPFIDVNNKVRAIQVKQFDEKNHTTGTNFIHSIIQKYHVRNNLQNFVVGATRNLDKCRIQHGRPKRIGFNSLA